MKQTALFLALCLTAAIPLGAQVDAGYLTGQVYDSSGAAVPSAGVQIRNLETSYKLTVRTNESGFHASGPLPVGRYRISVAQQGFQAVAVGPSRGSGTLQRTGRQIQMGLKFIF